MPRLCKLQSSKNESKTLSHSPSEKPECTDELCTMPWRAADPGCVRTRGTLIHWTVLNAGEGSGKRSQTFPSQISWPECIRWSQLPQSCARREAVRGSGSSHGSKTQRRGRASGLSSYSLLCFTGTPPYRGHLATLWINLPTHKPDIILKIGTILS